MVSQLQRMPAAYPVQYYLYIRDPTCCRPKYGRVENTAYAGKETDDRGDWQLIISNIPFR